MRDDHDEEKAGPQKIEQEQNHEAEALIIPTRRARGSAGDSPAGAGGEDRGARASADREGALLLQRPQAGARVHQNSGNVLNDALLLALILVLNRSRTKCE